MPVMRLTFPFGWTRCIFDIILPTSPVRVARTSTVLRIKIFIYENIPLLLLLLLLCKSKKSDIVLGIRADLSETNEIDTVLLGVETRWQIVTVSLIVAVIEAKMIAKFFMLNHD